MYMNTGRPYRAILHWLQPHHAAWSFQLVLPLIHSRNLLGGRNPLTEEKVDRTTSYHPYDLIRHVYRKGYCPRTCTQSWRWTPRPGRV